MGTSRLGKAADALRNFRQRNRWRERTAASLGEHCSTTPNSNAPANTYSLFDPDGDIHAHNDSDSSSISVRDVRLSHSLTKRIGYAWRQVIQHVRACSLARSSYKAGALRAPSRQR